MKKEIPILFSTMMVQAILQLIKTITRRTKGLEKINENPDDWEAVKEENETEFFFFSKSVEELMYRIKCPYGKVGDILWVREKHYRFCLWVDDEGKFTKLGRQKKKFVAIFDEVRYCDSPPNRVTRKVPNEVSLPAWQERSSLFMLKEHARIWLEVTDIKVERLHDITNHDALAEGIEVRQHKEEETITVYRDYGFKERFAYGINFKPRNSFFTLWQKINGDESYKQNPWVWAVSFKVLSTTGKPNLDVKINKELHV